MADSDVVRAAGITLRAAPVKQPTTRAGRAAAALANARERTTDCNHEKIMCCFQEKGIPASEIIPRENVLTFGAWRALGRVVCRGENGVKIATRARAGRVDLSTGEIIGYTAPGVATVFHISQTREI